MYPYGLVGNCQTSALISSQGSVDWMCLPRPDSPPTFGRILDQNGGHFSIEPVSKYTSTQSYLANTNILQTEFTLHDGSRFRVTDFCPRFQNNGRVFRPAALFRIVELLQGTCTVRVSCQPINGWEKEKIRPVQRKNHLDYVAERDSLRLVTNMSLTYLTEETLFVLKEPIYFGLTWNFEIQEDLVGLVRSYLEQTTSYWNRWVKHCSIPFLYQNETIRSALTLKLHCYEDTGAILAALTTSLPEELETGRNWDYRFCWLRDAYFVLSSLHRLGHFEEMEGFIHFLLSIAEHHESSPDRIHPVYRLDQTLPLPEIKYDNWEGYRNNPPVRSGNQAAEHVQNDVYGEMILTLAPIFFDQRFQHLRSKDTEKLIKHLVHLCMTHTSRADAGLWELRSGWTEHSFSNLMCWAGIDRVFKMRQNGFLKDLDIPTLHTAKTKAEESIRRAVKGGSLRNGPSDDSFDAALLLLPILRFPDSEICDETVRRIYEELELKDYHSEGFLYRYLRNDDFGHPKSAFLICSFWLVQALTTSGKMAEAKKVMDSVIHSSNKLGLFSEHYLPTKNLQLGNFPQAYSHVGQINAAFALSPPWTSVL